MRLPLSNPIIPGGQIAQATNALSQLAQQQAGTQTAQANALVAPQLAQGQANIATGIGQQELGQGAYANPLAQQQLINQMLVNKYYGPNLEAEIGQIQSQTGVNRQQAINLLQLQKLMPNEFALQMLKLSAEHPFKSLVAAGGPNALTGLENTALNIQSVGGGNAGNILQSTTPDFGNNSSNNSGNINTQNAVNNSLNSQQMSTDALDKLYQIKMPDSQINQLKSGQQVVGPDGYGYQFYNGHLYKSPSKVK